MLKGFFTLMFNLILFFYLLFAIFLFIFLNSSIIWGRLLTYGIFLLIIGICLSFNKAKIELIGLLLVFINNAYIIYIGYKDSLYSPKTDTLSFSIKISIFLTLYYTILYILKKILAKKVDKQN